MKKLSFCPVLLICLTIILAACTTETYYYTPSGLRYQIIETNKNDSLARTGNTVRMRLIQKVGDRTIETNYDKMPLYFMVMPGTHHYNPLEVFDYGLREGDSVKTVQRIDSMIKKGIFQKLPPDMHLSDLWVTTFRVEKVFRSDSAVRVDKEQETRRITALKVAESANRIENYLAKNSIRATSDTNHLYVQILAPGDTRSADTVPAITRLDFEVKTLTGKTLNSTTDTAFHQKPSSMAISRAFFPHVIGRYINTMRKGETIRLYIPGALIFGVSQESKETKNDDDVVIDLHMAP